MTNSRSETITNEEGRDRVLDDEIRSRLDKLNALSDLINSLEGQFDEANKLFRDTLKCSTDRLTTIAKTLGTKSIRHGRIYQAAKLSVEQSQSDCQRACLQFEQANKNHQVAREAIREAELKLRQLNGGSIISLVPNVEDVTTEARRCMSAAAINFSQLAIQDDIISNGQPSTEVPELSRDANECDTESVIFPDAQITIQPPTSSMDQRGSPTDGSVESNDLNAQETSSSGSSTLPDASSPTNIIKNASILGEELNKAIVKLAEAEKNRGQSQRYHMDQANKLMLAQENLIKMERDYSQSIKRSQLYFDEARRFNARLNSVKGDICKISGDIHAAKQAYAQTLRELEQFSDELHDSSV